MLSIEQARRVKDILVFAVERARKRHSNASVAVIATGAFWGFCGTAKEFNEPIEKIIDDVHGEIFHE